MNYHSDEWIMEKVFEHFQEAKTIIPEQHIVSIALQGSQNYGLDYEGSDVDTKCIVTPTFKNIALARKPMNTTHVRANDEHIDMKDIRLYLETFKKQNLNFLEILFTKYAIYPNSEFSTEWQRLVDNREKITHYNKVRCIKSMMGVASEKFFAMEHHYPSRMEWINKFSYDPKQLQHLLRIQECLGEYVRGKPFEECLHTAQADYLKEVKLGYYNLEDAREIAKDSYNKIKDFCDRYCEKYKNDPIDKSVEELLEDVGYNIMKISVEADFLRSK